MWRHNEHDGVSNTSLPIVYSTVYSGADKKNPSKLHVTGLCEGNSPVIGEFPAQRASNVENVSISWRHHDIDYIRYNLTIGVLSVPGTALVVAVMQNLVDYFV